MNLSPLLRLAAAFVALPILAASAHAALITVTATGRIVLLSHPFTTQFAEGQTFTYTFSYESTATPTVQQGTIRTIPMQTAALTINGTPVWQNGPVTGLTLSVINGNGTQTDRIAAVASPAGPNVNGTGVYAGTYVPLSMGMELYAPSTRLITTDIPTGFALSDWNPYALVAGSNVFLQLQPAGGGISTVRGEILTLTSTGGPLPGAPVITTQPAARSALEGASTTFTVAATGTGITYQWRKDNVAIPGATAVTYTIPAVTAASAGSYTVAVTNSADTVISAAAALTVVPLSQIGRLTNLAVRTTLAANQVLTVGFTMAGGGAKDVLVRAAGPGLGALGVPGTMADPKLALFNGSTQVAANDNWAGNATVASAIAAVGAFPFASTTSLDAALVASVDGGRTVQVSGPAAGNLIVEAYDAGSGASPRFTNLSALNQVGTGADVLIAGFTISGSTNRNVLIRAVGPSLAAAPFNLGGTLADPKLELYNSAQTKIDQNDTWSSTLATTFSSVGAFPLVAGSKDAAVIVNLPPGGYTVQVSGADGGTGLSIIELYELP